MLADFLLKTQISIIKIVLPANNRMMVKLNGSMALLPVSARRHNIEFAAKAMSANIVVMSVLVVILGWYIGGEGFEYGVDCQCFDHRSN